MTASHRSTSVSSVRGLFVPAGFAVALALLAVLQFAGQDLLLRACLGAAGVLAAWTLMLATRAHRSGRALTYQIQIHRHHWVQALAQGTVYAWWGWHESLVYAFMPLLLAQVLFAYGVEALLTWSRRDTYRLGFGPLPVVGSINLFLWFRPDHFHWQFALILVGYLGKELIRWQRDGRSAHIFNPSSFPLALCAGVLVALGASDITFGQFIANSQHDPPFIYLVIFLAALPGQILFGVARMTLAAVVTMVAVGWVYLQFTGTYFFYDAYIPVPVFLGMHLLFTDPSTSPRSERGRFLFGVLYALAIMALYVLLTRATIPTFYDKLLPVPILNLMVRGIDRLVRKRRDASAGPSRLLQGATGHVVWSGAWTVIFLALWSMRALGDRHPGQYLPFWREACSEGSARACDYLGFLTLTYCNNGSGWACNELGAARATGPQDREALFRRGCDLGFSLACDNQSSSTDPAARLTRGPPALGDLPVVLRGTKPPLSERDPDRLRAIACEQGWSEVCPPA